MPIRPNSPTKSCGRDAGSTDNTNGTDPSTLLPAGRQGTCGVRALVAGGGWGWLLRPLTSLGRLVPGCRARADLDPVCQRQLAGAATTATRPPRASGEVDASGRWIIGAWPSAKLQYEREPQAPH